MAYVLYEKSSAVFENYTFPQHLGELPSLSFQLSMSARDKILKKSFVTNGVV